MIPLVNNENIQPLPNYLNINQFPRAQITCELAEIETILAQFSTKMTNVGRQLDTLTKAITQWHLFFDRNFKSFPDGDHVVNVFIDALREVLRDPAVREPLDEEATLASDGRTYNSMCIAIYWSTPGNRGKCPVDDQNNNFSLLEPHPVVNYLVKWLKKYNKYIPPSDRTIQTYNQLNREAEVVVVRPPNLRNRIRGYLAEAAPQQPQQQIQVIRNQALMIQQNILVNEQRQLQEVDEARQNHQANLAVIQQAQNLLQEQIQELRNRNQFLEGHLQEIDGRVHAVERAQYQLEYDINQLKIAVKEREKNNSKGLLSALGIIGACLFATWALPTLAGSFQGAFLPAPNGFSLSVPI